MIRLTSCFLFSGCLFALSFSLLASPGPVVVEASEQVVMFDRVVRDRAAAISERLGGSDSADLIAEMVAVDESADLTPARIDAVFFELVRRLRTLAPWQVHPDVLAYLKNRPVQAVRRHDESADYLVPLFNVAAAVQGVENQWNWTEGFESVSVPGTLAVTDMLQRYAIDPEQPFARGVRAALPAASTVMLDKLAAAPVDGSLIDHFLPYLWLARHELDQLGNWLPVGPTRRVADVIRLAAATLDADQFQMLVQEMLTHPDAGSRAMALALLTDHYLAKGGWPEQWVGQLWMLVEDSEIHSAAALQLARLGAAERWQADPASAPADASGSNALERIHAIEQHLNSTRGGVR